MILLKETGEYRAEVKSFHELSKQTYHEINRRLVEHHVVRNNRLVNPIDDLDPVCSWQLIWKGEELVAQFRLVPTLYSKVWFNRNYPIVDKSVVTDKNISLFPSGSAEISMFYPELHMEIFGQQNILMEMYEEGHEMFLAISRHIPMMCYLGPTGKDKYGYDVYIWALEWSS